METEIINADGTRILTHKEMEKINSYNLMPRVREVIIALWAKKPVEKASSIKSKITGWLSRIFLFLLPVMLWTTYLTPKNEYLVKLIGENYNHYMGGLMNISFFLLWAMVIIFPLVIIFMIIAVYAMKDSDNIFNEGFLTIWKGKSKIKEAYGYVFVLALILGLIVNGYYLLPILYIIVTLLFMIFKKEVKDAITKRMKMYL